MLQITDFKTELLDIELLKPNPDNPRSAKKKDIERLKNQISRLGQYKPIIIDSRTGMMLGGHMRREVLKLLGIKEVLVSYITSKDDAEALEYALSDNDRIGFYSDDLLANLIPNFPEFKWEDYAVDLKEPQNIKELIDNYSVINEKEIDENIDTSHECPKCGYEW